MQVVCCEHATSYTGYIALDSVAANRQGQHIRQERYLAQVCQFFVVSRIDR